MTRSLILATVLAWLTPLLAPAALAAEPFQEGVHYFRLDEPVRTRDPGKIEVVEVFWYGCPHCFRFDPMIKAWQKTLPPDVDFHRLPVIWNATTQLHARAFYTAKALGVLKKMHDPLFDAMNIQGNPLNTEDKLRALFVANGVKAEDFNNAFGSFGVNSQVIQAKSNTLSYHVEGTPELIVDGKFRVDGRAFHSPEHEAHEKMLEVVNFLIAKERQAKGKK